MLGGLMIARLLEVNERTRLLSCACATNVLQVAAIDLKAHHISL